jgi:hypothetical protein
MFCTFIDTHCKYTTCIMRSLRWSSWCYWLAVDFDGRATVVEVGRRCCCLEDRWECCSSLGLARWGVLFSEARELIWLVPTKIFADLLLSLVKLRLPECTVLTPKLHCSNCTWKLVLCHRSHITIDGQSVSMSRYRAHSGTCDQILLSVWRLFSEICCVVSVGRPLWQQVVFLSLVIYQYLHQAFTLHVFYSSAIYIQYSYIYI